jgi:hypothetical protein
VEIIPIVTLDKIYISPDEENIFFLDSTRVNGTNKIISRRKETIDEQIKRLGKIFKGKEIILADDVVFSGTVLKTIIKMLEQYNVKVVGIITSITSNEGYEYFNKKLKYGLKANYIMDKDVIDQVCERDFYFGIAGSGIMIETTNGYFKAPYFYPYGNPNERASIPKEFEKEYSRGCLERSILLWEDIDKKKGKSTIIKELPEEIINTDENKEIVKTLKKEIRRI